MLLKFKLLFNEVGENGKYKSVETSDPANAKSHSWVLQREGRPEKQSVRYSTQLGPPAEVLFLLVLFLIVQFVASALAYTVQYDSICE